MKLIYNQQIIFNITIATSKEVSKNTEVKNQILNTTNKPSTKNSNASNHERCILDKTFPNLKIDSSSKEND